MKCNECKRWNGKGEWGDCYHIIGTLIPDIYKICDRFGFGFRVPFDPHDVKYLLERLPRPHSCDIPEGVKIRKIKERDIIFDDEGNERTRVVKLDFYLTHKDYYCGYEEM